MYRLFHEYKDKYFKEIFDKTSKGMSIEEMFNTDMKEKLVRYIKQEPVEEGKEILAQYMMFISYTGCIDGYDTRQREIERGWK